METESLKTKLKLNPEIRAYNDKQTESDREICDFLADIIDQELSGAESKIWHAHPVWFLDGNPIAGYSKQKKGIRLMFWSGAGFEEEKLDVKGISKRLKAKRTYAKKTLTSSIF